jgi:hypothetical protein
MVTFSLAVFFTQVPLSGGLAYFALMRERLFLSPPARAAYSINSLSATTVSTAFDRFPIGTLQGHLSDNELTIDPTDSSIMYLSTQGAGVLKTTDGGVTWTQKNIGLPGRAVSFVRIHPTNHQYLYAGMTGHLWSTGGQVYRSFDGGESWEPTIICDGIGDAQNMNIAAWSNDLQIDPTNPDRVYYGIWINNSRGLCGGLYRTMDNFQSYEPNPSCVSDPTVDYWYQDNDITTIRIDPDDTPTI